MKVGKARYGGEFTKKTYIKLKDGEASYRILPPLGDLAEKGIWSVFYNVHYGYRNSKGQMRTFQSPLVKDRKSKMVTVPDAALERIENFKSQFEKAKKENNRDMVERLDKLVGQKGMYNLDNNHHVNAIDTQGNVVILKLRHRAKLALDATIKRLREQGIDPLDLNDGRFFTFRRSGNGLDTSFQVEVMKEKLSIPEVGVVEREVVHKIDSTMLEQIAKQVAELDKLYKRPTTEEVARIVKEADLLTGKSLAVDAIFDSENAPVETEDYDDSAIEDETATTPVVAQAVTTPAPALQATQNLAAVTVATQVTPAPVATLPKTTAQAVSQMTDAEFLASVGLK